MPEAPPHVELGGPAAGEAEASMTGGARLLWGEEEAGAGAGEEIGRAHV